MKVMVVWGDDNNSYKSESKEEYMCLMDTDS